MDNVEQRFIYDEDGNLTDQFITGDTDCDGDVDFDDITAFYVALNGRLAYEAAYPYCEWLSADVDGDGDVDFDDIGPLSNLFGNGGGMSWHYTWDAENRLVNAHPSPILEQHFARERAGAVDKQGSLSRLTRYSRPRVRNSRRRIGLDTDGGRVRLDADHFE